MKIITSFLPPDEGVATVYWLRCVEAADGIGGALVIGRAQPLYKDMYVREYLAFYRQYPQTCERPAAGGREMIEMTGIEYMSSTNNRCALQRVPAAGGYQGTKCMLTTRMCSFSMNPLPYWTPINWRTSVDPSAGAGETVIFSTHIMQEVKAICDRVLIINRGKIVADDSIEGLRAASPLNRRLLWNSRKCRQRKPWYLPHLRELRELGKNRFSAYFLRKPTCQGSIFTLQWSTTSNCWNCTRRYTRSMRFPKLTQ